MLRSVCAHACVCLGGCGRGGMSSFCRRKSFVRQVAGRFGIHSTAQCCRRRRCLLPSGLRAISIASENTALRPLCVRAEHS